jgi:hypothetical protein
MFSRFSDAAVTIYMILTAPSQSDYALVVEYSNSRFDDVTARYKLVVATLVAGYAAQTTKVVTTNSITGIAGVE